MSERKVLNKYYPPDFDPSKLPKLRQSRERQYTVRIMAPFNMQCLTCGEYIYKGKKFNAKTENVIDESYLGLRIYRFYIKCPKCISEINFKTDPENTDYTMENGATRLFEASKTYQKQEEQAKQDKEEEEANNPMKVLENRTKDSKLEMEVIENLEELRDLNMRQAHINYADILKQKAEADEVMRKRQEEEDESEIRKYFGQVEDGTIKRLLDDTEEDAEQDETSTPSNSSTRSNKRPTDFLTEDSLGESPVPSKKQKTWEVSVGGLSSTKSSLAGLVKKVKKSSNSSSENNKPLVMVKDNDGHSSPINTNNPNNSTNSKDQQSETQTSGGKPSSIEQSDSQGQSSSSTSAEDVQSEKDEAAVGPLDSAGIMNSIREGLGKQQQGKQKPVKSSFKSGGLSLLGGYADSDSGSGSFDDSDDS